MPRRLPLTLAALLVALVATAALSAAAAGPAAAATKPCWKQLINDWYDGRIDKSYNVACYQQALKNLPEDVETYSSARDDIRRALLSASRQAGGKLSPGQVITPRTANQGNDDEVSSTDMLETATGPDETDTTTEGEEVIGPPPVAGGGGGDDGGLVGDIGPKNADSLPLPLLILAGVAILLLAAAGASYLARRLQERRGTLTPPPPGPPAP